MPKNVQIRNVNDSTYATLRKRAEANDLSLTQYLRRELDRLAMEQPTMAEWLDKADEFRHRYGGLSAQVVEEAFEAGRAERDSRFDRL